MLACLLKRVVLEEQFISSCLLPHLLKWLVLKRACLLSRTLMLSEEVVTEECAMCCHEVITMVEVAYPLPPRNKLEVAHSISPNYLSVDLPRSRSSTFEKKYFNSFLSHFLGSLHPLKALSASFSAMS